MKNLFRYRPSPSMLVALAALAVALSGSAVAATLITGANIKNGSVTGLDIKNSSLTGLDVKNNSLTGADVKNGSLGLGDLSAAAKTDLNDANTLGGFSVAQIVAAAGGRYMEARQAAGSVDIKTLTPQNLVTLNLPEAGKYLISARMPVTCTYDGSDATGATPDATTVLQPNMVAKAQLVVGGTVTDTVTQTCEAEAGKVIILAGIFFGQATVEVTRQIEVAGPTTVQLRGLTDDQIILFVTAPAAARVNATASGSIVQAISVRT